jgi:hypothetical protein
MSKYKLIQLTNSNILGVAANAYVPLGTITRRVNAAACDVPVFNIGTSDADVLYINEPGYYKITYTASLAASAAGVMGVSIVNNGATVVTASETAAAADDIVNVTAVYVVRVCPNCCGAPFNLPAAIKIQMGAVATSDTTASSANLLVERIY